MSVRPLMSLSGLVRDDDRLVEFEICLCEFSIPLADFPAVLVLIID